MDIYLGILAFTFIVALLVAFVMFARSQLVSTGDVTIEINGDPEKSITVPTGGKLLSTLAAKNIYLASAHQISSVILILSAINLYYHHIK